MEKQCQYCPPQNPYFNGLYFIICPNNQFYNATTHSFASCTKGKVFNPNKMICECPEDRRVETPEGCISCYLPNYFDLTCRACLSCPKNSIFNNSISGSSICPVDKPISSGSVCIPCPENTYFNATTVACQGCSGGRNYDKTKNQCLCPASQFYNGTNCIQSYLVKYFDLSDLTCKSCPANQIYSTINFRCSYCPA